MAEEYCWATKHTAARSYCGRSPSSLLGFGFKLDSHIYIYICGLHFSVHLVNSGLRKIGIAPDLPEHKFLLKSGACVRIPHAVSVSVKYT